MANSAGHVGNTYWTATQSAQWLLPLQDCVRAFAESPSERRHTYALHTEWRQPEHLSPAHE